MQALDYQFAISGRHEFRADPETDFSFGESTIKLSDVETSTVNKMLVSLRSF